MGSTTGQIAPIINPANTESNKTETISITSFSERGPCSTRK